MDRFANRIAKGHFVLEGKEYQMCINNGPNSLHGGKVSWGHVKIIIFCKLKRMWSFEKIERSDEVGVSMQIVSPDGEENYPGEMLVIVIL